MAVKVDVSYLEIKLIKLLYNFFGKSEQFSVEIFYLVCE